LTGENSSVPVKIPVNPHRVGLERDGDHQLRVALKISKTSVKMVKGSLKILASLNFGILGIIK
jgi:hypothetical protein